FTPLAERLDPVVLVRVLNGHFERMSRAITDHRGHVAKLIGDGILALFGALEPNPWHANDAAHAALAMSARLVQRGAHARGAPGPRPWGSAFTADRWWPASWAAGSCSSTASWAAT